MTFDERRALPGFEIKDLTTFLMEFEQGLDCNNNYTANSGEKLEVVARIEGFGCLLSGFTSSGVPARSQRPRIKPPKPGQSTIDLR